jgi:hypothetical protein
MKFFNNLSSERVEGTWLGSMYVNGEEQELKLTMIIDKGIDRLVVYHDQKSSTFLSNCNHYDRHIAVIFLFDLQELYLVMEMIDMGHTSFQVTWMQFSIFLFWRRHMKPKSMCSEPNMTVSKCNSR